MSIPLAFVFVVHINAQKSLSRWYGTVRLFFYFLRFSWMGNRENNVNVNLSQKFPETPKPYVLFPEKLNIKKRQVGYQKEELFVCTTLFFYSNGIITSLPFLIFREWGGGGHVRYSNFIYIINLGYACICIGLISRGY